MFLILITDATGRASVSLRVRIFLRPRIKIVHFGGKVHRKPPRIFPVSRTQLQIAVREIRAGHPCPGKRKSPRRNRGLFSSPVPIMAIEVSK